MMELPPFTSFGSSQPQEFYLAMDSDSFAALADATFVAEGQELPVHSQLLAMHSTVLRSLFAARGEVSAAPPPPPLLG